MRALTFNLAQHAHVLRGHEVDSDTLTTEATTTTDTVDVVLAVGGEIVVDDERNLLHVNTTGEKVRGDENTGRARAELLHQELTLLLVHVAVLRKCQSATATETGPRVYALTMAETVNSRECIFSVSQSTFLLVLQKMTAWVIVTVS